MGYFNSWNIGHALGTRDKITLHTKFRRDDSDRCASLSCYCYAVTHGAGSATASVAVSSDQRFALGHDALDQLCVGGS